MKLVKQLQEEELRVLFNEGISNQFGKKKSKLAEKAAALGIADVNKELQDIIEGKFDSDSDDDSDDNDLDVDYTVEEIDVGKPVEVFREKTIEDIIEEQRAKLSAEGKTGTPVTAESFAKWRAEKLQKKQAEAEARALAELAKKKGGKGLSVLTGKELFNFNSALFVDDDGAIDATEEEKLNAETLRSREDEEKKSQEEAERAQAEQQRLVELERIEYEVRQHKLSEWRAVAAASGRSTFTLGGVVVNEIIFGGLDESFGFKENLESFKEDDMIIIDVVVEKSEPITIAGGGRGEYGGGSAEEYDTNDEEDEPEDEGHNGEALDGYEENDDA